MDLSVFLPSPPRGSLPIVVAFMIIPITPEGGGPARAAVLNRNPAMPPEENWWNASVPSLPGCHSQGRSKEEAEWMIRDAMTLWLEVVGESGDPIPEADWELDDS